LANADSIPHGHLSSTLAAPRLTCYIVIAIAIAIAIASPHPHLPFIVDLTRPMRM